jgi:Ras-related protein Rab-8A
METSAKASINVEEAFFALARDIKAKMDKKLVCLSGYKVRVFMG